MEIRKSQGFDSWLRKLKDVGARMRILVRIKRLAEGNAGDRRVLKGGIAELKIDYGPGYRVYYAQRESELIILLCGGDKKSQQADIAKAIKLAENL
jgi:putative addiction module killer protein